jgi:hypothetical protein
MKKGFYFLLVVVSTLFLGCSSDDNGSTDDLFLKINVSGTEYNSVGLFATGFGGEENCLNNGDLFLQYVGQIENSNLFIECNFIHFENGVDFENTQKNIVTNTRLTDINDLWEANYNENVCSKNNDLSIVFEDKVNNTFLRLKPNTNKTHNITNVQFVSEDATSKFYIIEGNFNAMFLKGNIDVPINGNYRIKIEVYK